MQLDIYRLSEGNEGKGSIRAVLNPRLKSKMKIASKELSSYGDIKKFCKELEISYFVFWDYLNRRNYIPLFVLEKLEKISNINFKEDVKYLEYGLGKAKRNVKVVSICQELASIVGAFIADGHLKIRKTKWNEKEVVHYEIVFREGYKSNIIALTNWINKVFEINVKAKKEKNHYFIYISNKIISRYFTNIFGFKSGRKTETVTIPKIFFDSPENINKALIKGILMFDGSVSRKTGYIELFSKSRGLITGTSKLLEQIEIPPDYIRLNADKYGRYRLIIRKQDKLKRSLELFERDTEKYLRLKQITETFKNKKK